MLYNNVCVLDAITTITFLKPKTGHTISNSRSSETKSILHFLARSWIFVLPTLYSNVKKIKVVAVDKEKKEFRPFSELVCTNEFFCRRNSWNYFCMKQQTWYFCSNGNKFVDEEQKNLTRHELEINKKIRSKHAQEGSLFIPSSFDRLSQL